MGPAERINITVPKIALVKIDRAAAASGIDRSQFLVRSALAVSKGGWEQNERRLSNKVKSHNADI